MKRFRSIHARIKTAEKKSVNKDFVILLSSGKNPINEDVIFMRRQLLLAKMCALIQEKLASEIKRIGKMDLCVLQ